jgi:hypothetical protein
MAQTFLRITDERVKDIILNLSMPEPNSGCWIWLGGMTEGYGTFYHEGVRLKAHRASYLIHHGDMERDQVVMHLCDNKLCVNPDHLRAGTHVENVRDFWGKLNAGNTFVKRPAQAAYTRRRRPNKISDAQAAAIRASTLSSRKISELVGCHHTQISRIKRGLYETTQPVEPDVSLMAALSLSPPDPHAIR